MSALWCFSKYRILDLLIVLFCFHFALGTVLDQPTRENSTDREKTDSEKYFELTENIENGFKSVVKGVVKYLLPSLIQLNEDTDISAECMSSLMKYLKGLNQAKVWAVKMLDASSKLPPGVVKGTFADYGSFDECLELQLPEREGHPSFRGMSCALEARPPLPPISQDYTLVKSRLPLNNGTLRMYFRESHEAIHHKKFRLVVCVPSTCSLLDIRRIAQKVSDASDITVTVPRCYVKEKTQLHPVHWAFITCISVLFILCIIGTIVDMCTSVKKPEEQSVSKKFLLAFSLSTNSNRLLAPSGGSSELRCVHGIKALGMCWIVLGHTYVLMDFELLKDPSDMQGWFGALEFELIHNAWLAVETFFFISGVLVSYGGLKTMQKTKKTFNVPLMILRRYSRLTPSLLLLMGFVFFLPLLSSGPFFYEHVDPQVDSCRNHWWKTLLYVSNWFGIKEGCSLHTWYLAVDFQLHILSLLLLIILFKYSKVGLSLLISLIGISCAAIGLQTLVHSVTAAVQLSTVDDDKVMNALNHVHVHTLTHLAPYCIGMMLGYYIFKYRDQKLSKLVVTVGWLLSVILCLSTVLGCHRFTTGEETSQSLAIFYAAVHRSVFIIGVAWVVFACITGHGGPVNSLLSSSLLTPLGRLTFMVYLVHPLVIWTRLGSLRERIATTHYDFVYEYLANQAVSFAIAIPCYLLLESPLSNLDRIVFSRPQPTEDQPQEKQPQKAEHVPK